jgi:hypothetical protein
LIVLAAILPARHVTELRQRRGSVAMNVTLEQSIAIYARASISWFGDKAIEKTAQKADALAGRGDNEGSDVLHKVKAEIHRLQRVRRRRHTFVRNV